MGVSDKKDGTFVRQMATDVGHKLFFKVVTVNSAAVARVAVCDIPLLKVRVNNTLVPFRVQLVLVPHKSTAFTVAAVASKAGTFKTAAIVSFVNLTTGVVNETADAVLVVAGDTGGQKGGTTGGQQGGTTGGQNGGTTGGQNGGTTGGQKGGTTGGQNGGTTGGQKGGTTGGQQGGQKGGGKGEDCAPADANRVSGGSAGQGSSGGQQNGSAGTGGDTGDKKPGSTGGETKPPGTSGGAQQGGDTGGDTEIEF